jgi:mono/diheme cytochrome c family protein
MQKLLIVAAGWMLALAGASAQVPPPKIWTGVYTTAQAGRGQATFTTACIRCHGADLAGTTAPALKGEHFMATWGGGSLSRLFEKIRDTMPPQFGTNILSDTAKLEIVAFILQTNGFPAGARELGAGDDLAAIQILRQGEQAKVQNFSLVQTVGCLTRGDSGWMLRSSSEPVVTTANAPSAEALAAATSRPLGTGSFQLLSAAQFDPAANQGKKVEARGLIYQDPADALLTVTSLTAVGVCEG